MEELEKNHQRNAATILRERIAACEAADILATKEYTSMSPETVVKLMKLTRPHWSDYQPFLKLKIAKFHSMVKVLPSLQAALKKGKVDGIQESGLAVAGALQLTPTQHQDPLDMMNLHFNAVFHSFLDLVETSLKEASLWNPDQDDAPSEDDCTTQFGADLGDMTKKAPAETLEIEKRPELLRLLQFAQASFCEINLRCFKTCLFYDVNI